MKRKLIKRILTFALLLAMLVTMANPVSIYAEEPVVDDKKTESDDGIEEKQDFDEEKNTQQLDGTEGIEKADNEQYDTTKPVIEKVEFPQQGTTVKADDTIQLYVYAYDTETEEGGLSIEARISAEGGTAYMSTSYDVEKGCYVCEYNLTGTGAEKVSVFAIKAVDKAGNYSDYSCYENGEYKYWVSVEQQTSEGIHIKKFELKQNGHTLNEKDVLEMSLETAEDIKDGSSVYARFQLDNGTSGKTRDFSLYSSSLENRNKLECHTEVGNYYDDGPWILQGIYIRKGILGKEESLDIDGVGEFLYRVKKTVPFVIKPTITSVSLDKNGEFLSEGDRVNITIGATVDKGTLNGNGYVVFHAGSNIANSRKSVSLSYDESKGVYQGIFEITEDIYPCEWYIGEIDIFDMEHHSADDAAFTNGANYPYYVNVKNGETFTNPTYDVNISFLVLNEKGNWETIQEFHKEKVERRQTLKEIGVTFPEMASRYQGFVQTGWTDYDKNITENTQIIGNSGNMVIRAKYDKRLISASYRQRAEDGTLLNLFKSQKMEVPEDITYGQLREIVENVNVPEKTYPELVFQKWEMELPYNRTDESLFDIDRVYINAVYDKNCVTVEYTYVNIEGDWCRKEMPLVFEKDETYRSVLKEAKDYMPEDITKEYEFEQWDESGSSDITTGLGTIRLMARFSGKATIWVRREGYDKNGCGLPTRALILDENAKGRDVIKALKAWEIPEFYEGLRFKEWNITDDYMSDIKEDEIVKNGDFIRMVAVYENCIVRYLIDPIFVSGQVGWDSDYDLEAVICQVVEKGETVRFRESFDGYEKVVWPYEDYQPGDTFTVENNITFHGYGTEGTDVPEEPDKPTQPSQPENPSQPTNPTIPAPGVTLPKETIDNTVKIIKSAEPGASVSVDMNGATVISREILEAAKGKNVDIQLNMGGYTWTINGMDILASNLKDINLEVILDTKNIPSKTLSALAGDNPIRQLSLVHEGDFGFKASLTVNVGSEYSGQYGNLFYHDSDGKMVFINAGKINPDGNVSLEFSHASDYVIVMSNDKMSQSDVPAEISPTKDIKQGQTQKQSAKTGDEAATLMWLLCGASALGIMVFLKKRKKLV